jgi:hypothetical protein
VTEALMIAYGFTVELMVELVRVGLATATTERVVAPGCRGERTRVRITEAGRRALVRTEVDAFGGIPDMSGRSGSDDQAQLFDPHLQKFLS